MPLPGTNQFADVQAQIEGETVEIKCHAAGISGFEPPELIRFKACPGIEPILAGQISSAADGDEFKSPAMSARSFARTTRFNQFAEDFLIACGKNLVGGRAH